MKTIQQTVKFPAPPEKLFDIFLDSKKHAAAVNSQASVSRKVGGRFRIFGGVLQGKNLAIVPKRMIVQVWRGSNWTKSEGARPGAVAGSSWSTSSQTGITPGVIEAGRIITGSRGGLI